MTGLSINAFDDDYFDVDHIDDIGGLGSQSEAGEDGKHLESVASEDGDEGENPHEVDSESLPNLYSSFAKALGENGFLPGLEAYDDIDSLDKLGDKIREINKTKISEALGFEVDSAFELTDMQKEYLKALKDGIPPDVFVEAKASEASIDGITDDAIEDDAELRRNLITESYMLSGLSEEKARKLTQIHFDLGEDIDEAKSARDGIKDYITNANAQKIKEQQDAQENAKKERLAYEENLKNHFFNTEKIGDSFVVSKQVRDKMYNSIAKVAAKDANGTPINEITKYQIENPIDFQHKVAWLWSITDGFKNFDGFVTKKATTSAAKQLESVLNSTNFDTLGNVSTPGFNEESRYGLEDYRFDEEA